MLIIDGPNRELRDQLMREFERAPDAEFGKHISGFRGDAELKWIVSLVNCDHRDMIYQGFPTLEHHTNGVRHMVSHALLASGTLVALCVNPDTRDLGPWHAHPCVTPTYVVTPRSNLKFAARDILAQWRAHRAASGPVWEFGSTGGLRPGGVMLVGDRVNPFVPLDKARRAAFLSHHGSSLWLHTALAATRATDFYVTNAHKVQDTSANCIMLTDEVMRVAPRRIIAMGDEAQAYMSELDTQFERTYHPQYWSRFRRKYTTEFTKLLTGP